MITRLVSKGVPGMKNFWSAVFCIRFSTLAKSMPLVPATCSQSRRLSWAAMKATLSPLGEKAPLPPCPCPPRPNQRCRTPPNCPALLGELRWPVTLISE